LANKIFLQKTLKFLKDLPIYKTEAFEKKVSANDAKEH
jgi:hypothetical protein